jgi:hypothetical protein
MLQSAPDETVAKWWQLQPSDSIWITGITVLEIRFGLLAKPTGRGHAVPTKAPAILLQEKKRFGGPSRRLMQPQQGRQRN